MDQHLRVALEPLVEQVIRLLRLLDPNLVRNDEARLGLARDDEIPEVPVVLFDVALPRGQREPLS
jgi:hypothetical protein